jgi:O-antigen/teichoic acid export membrane protein
MLSYLIVMIASSALGVIKILYLSYILSPEDFGSFIALYSISIFSATLLSFGLIETTLKSYPILIKNRNLPGVVANFIYINKIMFVRYIILTAVLLLLQHAVPVSYNWFDIILGIVLGYLTSNLLIFASIVRSIEKSSIQQKFFFSRSLTTFVTVVFCALFCEWNYLILAECIGLAISILYTFSLLKKVGFTFNMSARLNEQRAHEGGVLYFAFLLSSGISQVDKMLVGQLSSSYQAGRYGFMMIFVQVFTLLYSIITQRVGPKFLINSREGVALCSQFKPVLFWVLSAVVFSFLSFALYYLTKDFKFISAVVDRYDITENVIVGVLIIGVCQVYVLLDYMLIAYDRELDVLVASLLGAMVFVFGFFMGYLNGLTLGACIVIMLSARLVQVVMQLLFLIRVHKRQFVNDVV